MEPKVGGTKQTKIAKEELTQCILVLENGFIRQKYIRAINSKRITNWRVED